MMSQRTDGIIGFFIGFFIGALLSLAISTIQCQTHFITNRAKAPATPATPAVDDTTCAHYSWLYDNVKAYHTKRYSGVIRLPCKDFVR